MQLFSYKFLGICRTVFHRSLPGDLLFLIPCHFLFLVQVFCQTSNISYLQLRTTVATKNFKRSSDKCLIHQIKTEFFLPILTRTVSCKWYLESLFPIILKVTRVIICFLFKSDKAFIMLRKSVCSDLLNFAVFVKLS